MGPLHQEDPRTGRDRRGDGDGWARGGAGGAPGLARPDPGRRDVHFAFERALLTAHLECKLHRSSAKCTSRVQTARLDEHGTGPPPYHPGRLPPAPPRADPGPRATAPGEKGSAGSRRCSPWTTYVRDHGGPNAVFEGEVRISTPGAQRRRAPRPARSPGNRRARHLTREHVALADVLAGRVTISRAGRVTTCETPSHHARRSSGRSGGGAGEPPPAPPPSPGNPLHHTRETHSDAH